jgi:Ca2+/Na+ antiporter
VQLAVVIASVLQHKTPLALGNVMGSTISNVLGAFSLGLLVHPGGRIEFDRSARMYTTFLLLVTTVFVLLAYFGALNQIAGGVLIAVFAIYLASVGYAIYQGIMEPPEDSDSDSDDGDDSRQHGAVSETSPLLGDPENAVPVVHTEKHGSRSLAYHISQLIMGLVALTLSGYILSHSAATIAESLHLSGTVIGITVLSFATTLPEKLVAILSGSRGHSGIVVANTAGSNIFLLTLCIGIVAVAGMPEHGADDVVVFELAVTWLSSALLWLVVFLRPSRLGGVVLLALYVAFLVLELTVYRR